MLLFLITGMNSHADLLFCQHVNGSMSIVTSEYHESVHEHDNYPVEQSNYIHTHGETCFDIPILIKNIAIVNQRSAGLVKFVSSPLFNISDIYKNFNFKIFLIQEDIVYDLPDFSMVENIVLLI